MDGTFPKNRLAIAIAAADSTYLPSCPERPQDAIGIRWREDPACWPMFLEKKKGERKEKRNRANRCRLLTTVRLWLIVLWFMNPP